MFGYGQFLHLGIWGHSFRIGTATFGFVLGFTSDQIRAIGRWQSTSYRFYVHPRVKSDID